MEKSRFTTTYRIVVSTMILFSTMVFAQAQTFLGTAGDGLWSNANNWLDGVKPDGMFSEATISANVFVDEDVSIGTLYNSNNCALTVLTGRTLYVNNNIEWGDNDFILEDKAKLVYGNPLHVKIKKNISAFDNNAQLLSLVASPVKEEVMPSIENGFLTDYENGYVLYAFNPNNLGHSDSLWIDFKKSPFSLTNGNAYLYANAFDTTLLFEGTTIGYSAEFDLSYHPENGAFAGCHFTGNPLPCNAFLNRSYYILSDESKSLIAVANSETRSIAPCSGIILNSIGPEDTGVLFSHMPFFQYLENNGYIEITSAKSNAPTMVLDQALLSFNEGDDLVKYVYYKNTPQVYFNKDDKDLAILSIDSTNYQTLRFKAAENGSYALHFNLKNLGLNYLHLWDNLTGANVDLLANPNYTFNASTSDYTSRFKLVFDPHYDVEEFEDGPSTGSGTFAYYANGEIVINDIETQDFASIQIVDLTGRVIVSGDATNRIPTRGMTPGIYVLRLKTQNGVRTQKIMIQ